MKANVITQKVLLIEYIVIQFWIENKSKLYLNYQYPIIVIQLQFPSSTLLTIRFMLANFQIQNGMEFMLVMIRNYKFMILLLAIA
jgi:hypothetical protein